MAALVPDTVEPPTPTKPDESAIIEPEPIAKANGKTPEQSPGKENGAGPSNDTSQSASASTTDPFADPGQPNGDANGHSEPAPAPAAPNRTVNHEELRSSHADVWYMKEIGFGLGDTKKNVRIITQNYNGCVCWFIFLSSSHFPVRSIDHVHSSLSVRSTHLPANANNAKNRQHPYSSRRHRGPPSEPPDSFL